MPDTKTGREKKGLNKETQLDEHLLERELDTLDSEEDLPEFEASGAEFLTDDLPAED